MSITTNAELLSTITNWLGGRSDLTSYYADWVTLFEARAARTLRVRSMESTATITVTSAAASLPSDYLGWRRVTWTGSPNVDLEYAHPSWVTQSFPDSTVTGTPTVFTIEGSTLRVRPASDTSLSLLYYTKNTAVSSALNWLFTNFPDAYLFGALTEAQGFVNDPEALMLWKSRRDEVMDEVSKFYFREAGQMRIRVAGVAP